MTGSKGCRECHERFYQLWSASFHGLAMQAFTPKLAKEKLTEPAGDLAAGNLRYRADIGGDAAWADNLVRAWRPRDFQAPVLRQAGLVAAARKREWKRLPEMLSYLEEKERDEVVATSLVRLLRVCPDDRRWPAFIKALSDPSPLVRGAAAAALTGHVTPDSIHQLLAATRDDYRLVRVRAAETLAGVPPLVNASMAYYALGDKENAEKSLRRAVKIAPESDRAQFRTRLQSMGK